MRNLPEPIVHAIESGRIPSPPQILLRLMHLVDDDRSTMTELAALVGHDAGLAARVLTAANSPALRRGRELNSLDNCLVALGTRLVRSIATCLSIQRLFDRSAGQTMPDLEAFWGHSLMVAELSRNLAAAVNYPRPEEAYLAGLLHDVGELILLSAIGQPYADLLACSHDEPSLCAHEIEKFGVHHGEVGTWLTDKWKLDTIFADGILFHHATPEEIVTATTLPQIVWLAHALSANEQVSDELLALEQTMFGPGEREDLATLRDEAEQRTRMIGEALNLRLPVKLTALRIWDGPATPPRRASEADGAESAIVEMLGGMALLQPLQQDLFALESDAEILLSLRESARILFDLPRTGFLLADADDGKLSGKNIGGQPVIFRQVEIPLDEQRSLAGAAAVRQEICSSFADPIIGRNSLIDLQFARAFSSEGLLCIPMVARRRTVGVIVSGLSANQYGRLARRLPWLLNFGKIAALSLEALREAKSYRRQADQEAASRFTRQARRVVHEAANPLGIIKSYLKILDRKIPDETGVRQELEILAEEIDRVASIVHRMSEIPKDQTPGAIDPGELIRELLLLYGDTLFKAKGIHIETDLPEVALKVTCERDSLKQMLLNLWKNASEALSAGHQLTISLTDHVIHNGQTFIQICMHDNGPGMSENTMRAIHLPADAAGAGARGMGLPIVGELARQQGIEVICLSQKEKGTCIALLFPKTDIAESGTSGERGQSTAQGGTSEK